VNHNSIILQQRANAAGAAIDAAKTPLQKQARQQGLSVYAELAKHLSDEKALAAFKNAKPENSGGMWNGAPLVIYMTRADGKKITAPVTLSDGSIAAPNPQYQIAVPLNLVNAMLQRGYVRANDVLTDIGEKFPIRDPVIPNGDAP